MIDKKNPKSYELTAIKDKEHSSRLIARIALPFISLLCCFLVIEIGYRIFDPFPHFTKDEVNHTEHGNLTVYDETLGWKGSPNGKAEFVTENSSTWLQHNSLGFRDIEHGRNGQQKPAIVFLGDSFTWGYEVDFDDMFVNQLRNMVPEYEIFNLAHRGYGTDQELLTFKNWHYDGKIPLVILMFSENDMVDNNAGFRWGKSKPKYSIVGDDLVLTGVPVPKVAAWTKTPRPKTSRTSVKTFFRNFLYHSHFLHDVFFRIRLIRSANAADSTWKSDTQEMDLRLTSRILQELKIEVGKRNSKLVVFFVPSKLQIEQLDDSAPYQTAIAALCEKLDITSFDLAPHFKDVWGRTYYRLGRHWTARGNKVAAKAIYEHLAESVLNKP